MFQVIEYMKIFLEIVNYLFVLYLIGYSTFLFLSATVGSYILYKKKREERFHNKLYNEFFIPVSILVPAHNEEITIIDSVESLLKLDYKLYEIVIIDDGSTDNTVDVLLDYYDFKEINSPVRRSVECKPIKKIYETTINNKKITLVMKENGGKGDALNCGINVSSFPYVITIDADSMLDRNALSKIVQPILLDDTVIAVGGIIRISNGVTFKDGEVYEYNLPKEIIPAMQVLEYDRSFLASRILLDTFNGNLIISGAFGLFRKDLLIAVGGYSVDTVGEDFELVFKLHVFCLKNNIKYRMKYEPTTVCWTQCPPNLKSLYKQRKRWNRGLLQGMTKYKDIFLNRQYGVIGVVSYLYYLIYELLSPFIELFGILTIIISYFLRLLNVKFMVMFMIIYVIYSSILTIYTFFSRIHTEKYTLKYRDIIKALLLCGLELFVLRFILLIARISAFFNKKKNKTVWDRADRVKN